VLVINPFERPRAVKIVNTEDSVKKIIEAEFLETILDSDEPALIVCNAEGIADGNASLNRALYDKNGNIWIIITGAFIVCNAGYSSLSPRQEMFYRRKFNHPDLFVKSRGVITVL